MELVPAETKHIELIHRAFEQQREFWSLQNAGYLAQPEVVDFHRDRICKRIEKQDSNPIYLYIARDQLIGIIGFEHSQWHREHFGHPYYKIQPFFCFSSDRSTIQLFLSSFHKKLTQDTGGVWTTRIPAHEHVLLYELQQYGFIQVGMSTRFSLQNNKKQVDTLPSVQYDSLTIRDFQQGDLEALKRIAIENHQNSHFYQEVRFSREQVRSIFGKWIERCSEGTAKKILVAEQQDQIVGFANLLVSHALVPYIQKRIGVIDFIVADRSVQGQGIGARLLQSSLLWFSEQVDLVELRTMADNLKAIRFYEKHGFRILSSDHHFHYWNDG